MVIINQKKKKGENYNFLNSKINIDILRYKKKEKRKIK